MYTSRSSAANNVAHEWANQTKDAGKTQGNVFFENKTIYSYGYHFPIARHMEIKGAKFVLFTLRTYSNTTAKHISSVRSAASHLDKVYVYEFPYNAEDTTAHEKNLRHWFEDIKGFIKLIGKARNKAKYAQEIEIVKGYINTYLTHFPAKLTKEQKSLMTITSTEELNQLAQKEIERQKRELQQREKLARPVLAWKYAAWQNYEDVTRESAEKLFTKKQIDAAQYYNENAILEVRLRTNGNEVETSKDVVLPVAVARRAYETYLRIVEAGGCDGNCKFQIMQYNVNKANADQLIVGCHDIRRVEIDYIAKKLNW